MAFVESTILMLYSHPQDTAHWTGIHMYMYTQVVILLAYKYFLIPHKEMKWSQL